jgi:hypothetical protein
MSYAAVGGELDLGVAAANSREAVDAVDGHAIALARHVFYRDSVVPEPGNEAVPFSRLRRARLESERGGGEGREE